MLTKAVCPVCVRACVRACVRTRVRALSAIVLFNSNLLVTLTDDFYEFTLNHSVSAVGPSHVLPLLYESGVGQA